MKNKLPYCKTAEAIVGYENSVIAKNENKDCVVRALASAFDMSYDESHKFVENKFKRKPRQGTKFFISTMNEMANENLAINSKKFQPMGIRRGSFFTMTYDVVLKGKEVKRKMTVGTFIKNNPIGTFVICVRGHAFTIKNGVVVGNPEDATKKKKIIQSAWEVKN